MSTSEQPHLRRALGPVLLTLYGIGVTIGAGIYVLVGEVAAVAGMAAPIAFMLAGVLAGLSAFSYAELSTQFPRAGGEASYVSHAFAMPWLTTTTGLLVAFSGITSSAAVLLGFVGYLNELVAVPGWVALVGVISLLAVITFWGVSQSLIVVAVTTLIEIGGLLLVIGAGLPVLENLPAALPVIWPGMNGLVWVLVVSSSVLAFFAFIGFEDIVNMAEEVRSPSRTLPIAIITTLAVSTLLYVLLTTISVLIIEPGELGSSDAPLAHVFEASGGNPAILSSIAILAVVNGALIQMIMASRLLYGMARLDRLPQILAHVNPVTRTPDVAIIGVALIVLVFALTLPIAELASYASFAVLAVFAIANVALLALRHSKDYGTPPFKVYLIVPVLGAGASLALLGFGLAQRLGLIG
ncbi:APC family permease [Pyruvatibacter sp.]